MTYREKLKMEYPDCVWSDRCNGYCFGCPGDYLYGPEHYGNRYCPDDCERCWNKEYKGEKKMATSTNVKTTINAKQFKKEDLKPGYVVRLRCGENRLIMPVGKEGTLIAIDDCGISWDYISSWGDTFEYKRGAFEQGFPIYKRDDTNDIVEVYGYVIGTPHYDEAVCDSTEHRERLWKRTEAKKMTVAEINAALGYEVEIVADKED